jgi:hypothetical protein
MQLIRETDFGTPASVDTETVSLTVDGVAVTVPAVPGRDRGAGRDAGVVHHAGGGRDESADADG